MFPTARRAKHSPLIPARGHAFPTTPQDSAFEPRSSLRPRRESFDTHPMTVFAGLAGSISVLVGWLVTARLFGLARQTRAVPESLLAIAFGGLFCVGYPLAGASRAPGLHMTNEGSLLFALGAIGMVIGVAALGRFPYVVFRPGESWASLLSAAITTFGAIGGLGCAGVVANANTAEAMVSEIQPWAVTLMAAVALSFFWNALESSRYFVSMKRRLALGLAHPETTHRFLLWAIASWCTFAAVGTILAMRASGIAILATLPMTIISCSALVASTCWWLAFFMPDAYRSRVLGIAPVPDRATD